MRLKYRAQLNTIANDDRRNLHQVYIILGNMEMFLRFVPFPDTGMPEVD